jgi:hypothetical protein
LVAADFFKFWSSDLLLWQWLRLKSANRLISFTNGCSSVLSIEIINFIFWSWVLMDYSYK